MVEEQRQECTHVLTMRVQICPFDSMYLAFFGGVLWYRFLQKVGCAPSLGVV